MSRQETRAVAVTAARPRAGFAIAFAAACLLGVSTTAVGQDAVSAAAPRPPASSVAPPDDGGAPGGISDAPPASPKPDATQDTAQDGAQSKSRISDVAIPLQLDTFPRRPRPLIELGQAFLGTGPIHGFKIPTGAVWTPSLLLFGTYRTGVSSSSNFNATGTELRTDQWSNRFDVFANLTLTFTERLVVGFRPIDETDPTGARKFSGYSRTVSPTATTGDLFKNHFNFGWPTISHLFFEGDFGEIFPGLDKADKHHLDYGLAIGRQPISFQEGLLINDTIDAVGVTRNNLKLGNLVSLRITGLFAWNQINRNTPNGTALLRNEESDGSRLVALFTEADTRAMTIAIDGIYVAGGQFNGAAGATTPAGNGVYAGLSLVGRPGSGVTNEALRFLVSEPVGTRFAAGAVTGVTDPAARGALILNELSWTPHASKNFFYANAFAAIEDYRAAALDPLVPGPLARVGILFEGSGIGDGAPLSPTASAAVGGSLGHQRFFASTRQQLLVEAAGRYGTRSCPGPTSACDAHQVGLGARYQIAAGRHFIFVLDGSLVGESLRGSAAAASGQTWRTRHGFRIELLTQL